MKAEAGSGCALSLPPHHDSNWAQKARWAQAERMLGKCCKVQEADKILTCHSNLKLGTSHSSSEAKAGDWGQQIHLTSEVLLHRAVNESQGPTTKHINLEENKNKKAVVAPAPSFPLK